jgi:hypothetical protein
VLRTIAHANALVPSRVYSAFGAAGLRCPTGGIASVCTLVGHEYSCSELGEPCALPKGPH